MRKMRCFLSFIVACAVLLSVPIHAGAESDGERAERFLSVVARLDDCADLNEREAVYDEAMSEEVYFSDESYDGVTEALAELAEVEKLVGLSVAFIGAAEQVSLAVGGDYATLRAALDEAEGYYSRLTDRSYDGVSGAYAIYSSVMGDLTVRERYTADVLALGKELCAAESFAEKEQLTEAIEDAMSSESYIEDYPGTAELYFSLLDADEYMRAAILNANLFIQAVDGIEAGADYGRSLIAAYAALRGVDTTADGVALASRIFNEKLSSYNRGVRELNEIFG